jgi:hypothetical protein
MIAGTGLGILRAILLATLRSCPASSTLGHVKRLRVLISSLTSLALVSVALAQVIPPLQVGGPAQGALQQLHPPTPLEQVREQALRRSSPLPPPLPPAERWVPERQIYAPELGRSVVIPGHYERRVSEQQSVVPTLPAYEIRSGTTIIVPGGERPPADLRQGP